MTQSRLNKCCHKLKYQIADTQMMVLKNQIPYMRRLFCPPSGGTFGCQLAGGHEADLIVDVKPGAGERVMRILMSMVEGTDVTLEVASTNERAIRLYEKLNLIIACIQTSWYDVSAFFGKTL